MARFDPNADGSKYTRTDLTDGPFVVTSILSWDSVNGYVYVRWTRLNEGLNEWSRGGVRLTYLN